MTCRWLSALGASGVLLATGAAVSRAIGASKRRRTRVLGRSGRAGRPAGICQGATDPAWSFPGPAALMRSVPPPAAAVLAGALGSILGGPVAGFISCAYTALLARGARRHRRARARSLQRVRDLDGLCALAADLRAGLPPALLDGGVETDVDGAGRGAMPPPATGVRRSAHDLSSGCDARAFAAVAVGLAETTGAPLAELIERIEADARSAERAATSAAAQAAGVRATAWLLAMLPLGGIGLGYGIGVDPLHVLLRTPVGGGCAVVAVVLQIAGLAWAERLAQVPDPVALPRPAGYHPGAAARSRPCRKVAASLLRRTVAWSGPCRAPTGPGARRLVGVGAGPRPFVAALVGIATALFVGGWVGLPCGMAAAVAAHRMLRRIEPARVRAEREFCAAVLPLAADLLAAALRSGAPGDRAVASVAVALGGPLGERFARTARSLRLGAEPEEAWEHLAGIPGAARLTAAAVRSSASGSALAGALTRLADDLRADRTAATEAAVRRAGVLIVLPLGLCFLPAFILAGLAPVVVAVLGGVLQ